MKLSKTVYSLFYPETQAVTEEYWKELPSDLYTEAYTGKQDGINESFFNSWKKWVTPVLTVPSHLTNFYPAAGSSEAIRESIIAYVTQQLSHGHTPRLHVFKGDYEGYKAFAEAYNATVIEHDRNDYEASFKQIYKGEAFYLSQPSSIDGNVWDGFDEFLKVVPSTKVMVDLCYVGAVHKEFKIILDSEKIHSVFFSLSKSFGVYYHRIGGVVSRAALPGLAGNIWFKNVFSLNLGIRLMEKYGVFDLARKYHVQQVKVIKKISKTYQTTLNPSDVVLLANTQKLNLENEFHQEYKRQEGLRVCLSPEMDKEIRK